MIIGPNEIITVILTVILFVGIPIALIWAGVLLFRRVHELESRIEKLEASQKQNLDKMP